MRSYFLTSKKRSLFKYYWLTTFLKWFSFTFFLFSLLFWINQVLLLGKNFISLNFSIGDILLLGFYSLPFIGDMLFPIIIFLSLFWLLSYLISQKEFLAWQNLGISSVRIIFFLFSLVFYFSICFFFINDFMQAFSLSSQRELFQKWEISLLKKMGEKDFHLKLGDLELFNIKEEENIDFYILYPLREYQRSFFLLQGKSNSEEEGVSFSDSSFFSPSALNPESYYQGEIGNLSLRLESFFSTLDTTFSSYFLPFSHLTYLYLVKDPSLKKEHIFLWHQKLINLISTWVLSILVIFFSFKKAKEGQGFYPFWVGILLVILYIFLSLFFRVLFFYFWDKSFFILLWTPLLILILVFLFSGIRKVI